MMRLVLIIFILSLCAINSGAQVKIMELTKDSCLCLVDPQSADSAKERARFERIFHLRTAQRMHQLNNTINFIGNDIDSAKVAYYKYQILALFDVDAKVMMRRKRKVESIGIKDFIEDMANHKIILKSLDSIRVPKWNYELIKGNNSDTAFSKSEMIPFKLQQKFGNDEEALAIIKEETEDGVEWIPKLGDMVVTLKKNKNRKKK